MIHTYYTVALAPAIAALVAIGGALLWRARARAGARVLAGGAVVAVTAGWAYVLLDRTPQLGAVAARADRRRCRARRSPACWRRRLRRRAARRMLRGRAVLGVVACLAGPVAYAAQTITTAHTGSIPSAGPGVGGRVRRCGGFGAGGGARRRGRRCSPAAAAGRRAVAAGGADGAASGALIDRRSRPDAGQLPLGRGDRSGSQTPASLELATGGEPVMAIGGFNNEGGNLTLAQFERYVARGRDPLLHRLHGAGAGWAGGWPQSLRQPRARGRASAPVLRARGARPIGAGGSAQDHGRRVEHRSRHGSARPERRAARAPAALQRPARRPAGLRRGRLPPGAGSSSRGPGAGGPGGYSSSSITSWVKAHYKSVTIGGQTVYDLTTPNKRAPRWANMAILRAIRSDSPGSSRT